MANLDFWLNKRVLRNYIMSQVIDNWENVIWGLVFSEFFLVLGVLGSVSLNPLMADFGRLLMTAMVPRVPRARAQCLPTEESRRTMRHGETEGKPCGWR